LNEQDAMLGKLIPSWFGKSSRQSVVEHQSAYQNIYHCTVQKSASQWIREILSNPRIYQYSGLTSHAPRYGGDYRRPNSLGIFPANAIVTPLYIQHDEFVRIPKPRSYRAFFVMRDPRDVVTSWYYSMKYSHSATAEIEPVRHDLNRLNESDGFVYAIDFLRDYGLFEAQRSWAGAADDNVMLVRFEDLVSEDQVDSVRKLLTHCDIAAPPEVLADLLTACSFESLSGRRRGDEDRAAHYRNGIPGDWRKHFDARIHARFLDAAGDVLGLWNYE
jgi:hypothetical protein